MFRNFAQIIISSHHQSELFSVNRALFAVLALLLLPSIGLSEGVERSSVVFKTINATTGEPCTIDSFRLQESTTTMDEVAKIEPTRSVFTLDDVPLVDGRAYIATAWFQDVPYFWEFRGRFIDQDTNTIHVFSTTPDAGGVVISGLNIIIKKQESLTRLEYVLQVDNRITPQATVSSPSTSLEIMFPSNATGTEAVYHRGPEGTSIQTRVIGNNRLGLIVPLTPGLNRIHIKANLEWQDDMEIPVGSSLPIEAWSLLGSPDYLEFNSFDLEFDNNSTVPGMKRMIGSPIAADREVLFRVDSRSAPAPQGEIFSKTDSTSLVDGDSESEDKKSQGNKVPIPLLALALILTVLIGIVLRKRGKS